LSIHLIRGSYRRDRHGPLPGTPPEPAVTSPEPDPLDAELEKWRMALKCGYDFFNETGLDPFAVRGPDAERRAAERRFISAMRAAWKRLGRRFMATWQPDPDGRSVPWALRRFGEP
jgi:hypothetical protein